MFQAFTFLPICVWLHFCAILSCGLLAELVAFGNIGECCCFAVHNGASGIWNIPHCLILSANFCIVVVLCVD